MSAAAESAGPSAVTGRAVPQCRAGQTDRARCLLGCGRSVKTLPVTFSRRLRSSSCGCMSKVTLEQFDQRQIRRGFPVRDGVGFQDQAATLGEQLEFVEQPRLP